MSSVIEEARKSWTLYVSKRVTAGRVREVLRSHLSADPGGVFVQDYDVDEFLPGPEVVAVASLFDTGGGEFPARIDAFSRDRSWNLRDVQAIAGELDVEIVTYFGPEDSTYLILPGGDPVRVDIDPDAEWRDQIVLTNESRTIVSEPRAALIN